MTSPEADPAQPATAGEELRPQPRARASAAGSRNATPEGAVSGSPAGADAAGAATTGDPKQQDGKRQAEQQGVTPQPSKPDLAVQQNPVQQKPAAKDGGPEGEPSASDPEESDSSPQPRGARLARKAAAVARNIWFRIGFLVVVVAIAGAAVAADSDAFVAAARQLGAGSLALAFLGTCVNILSAATVWRVIIADLGSPLGFLPAGRVFLAGQLGKYLPGSVWFLLAQMELAAEVGVPRQRSATASIVTVVLSVSTALVTTVAMLPFVPTLLPVGRWWLLLLLPLLVVLLLPPVLNWGINRVLWLVRRAPLEHEISNRGALTAVAWSFGSWLAVGLHVFVLATAVGAPSDWRTLIVCVGGYAVAWAVGFVAVVAPAGAGAREIALGLVLATVLSPGATLVVVLVSRVLQTLGDFALAGLALVGANLHLKLTGPANGEGSAAAGSVGEAGSGTAGSDTRRPE